MLRRYRVNGALLAIERDRWLRRFVDEIPALNDAVGTLGGLQRLTEAVSDDWVVWRGKRIHLEVLNAGRDAPVVVFHHGFAAYSRLYLPFLGALWMKGYTTVGIDRPGHGLSCGRRGDCTVGELAEVTRATIRHIVSNYERPVILIGSSAGGMLCFCMLPLLSDLLAAAVCHTIYDFRYSRLPGGPAIQTALEALPPLRLPFSLIPRDLRSAISHHAVVRSWFRRGADPLAAYSPTLRSVTSMTVGYRALDALHTLNELPLPVLVLSGREDRMVPVERSIASFERAGLPKGKFHVVEGAGHMLLHENLVEVVSALVTWLETLAKPCREPEIAEQPPSPPW